VEEGVEETEGKRRQMFEPPFRNLVYSIGVGDGGQGGMASAPPPKKIGKNIFRAKIM